MAFKFYILIYNLKEQLKLMMRNIIYCLDFFFMEILLFDFNKIITFIKEEESSYFGKFLLLLLDLILILLIFKKHKRK